jgi:DNA-binding SARP family transcriptional activator
VPEGWIDSLGEELMLQAEVDLPGVRLTAAKSLEGHELTLEEIGTLSEDVLPGWHEEWATRAQDAFRLLRVQALEAACRSMAAAGHHDLAAQAGLAALAAEPLRESAADALICAHLLQGNRYEALRCYQEFARHLKDELGVRPDPALSERFDAIASSKAEQNGGEIPMSQTAEIEHLRGETVRDSRLPGR